MEFIRIFVLPLLSVLLNFGSVRCVKDDKAELQKIREETNKKSPMGRGHRIKKRKIIESESDDNVSQQQPKKKKSKQPDYRSLMKEILEEVPQQTTDKDSTIQRLEKELEEVKQEKKELRAENKNMRRMIRIMTNLPDMMAQMRDLMTPSTRSTDGGSTNNMVQPEAPQKTITTGIDAIMKRCNHQEPAKMVNDILTGMYSNQYLAGRTLTGVSGSGKEAKEPMDPEVVNGIIDLSEYDKYEDMVTLDGGRYWRGVDDKKSKDGSHPAVQTSVKKFKINKFPITNHSFRKFVKDQRYITTAEEYAWSFVFESDVPENIKSEITDKLPNAEWWLPVPKAYWKHPEGDGSNINSRLNWPAVHISHIDATAYCKWKGLRLTTEDEWEFAVRGSLSKKKYPWGDKYEKNRMNIWQGKFPGENKASDGYTTVAPVDAYPAQNNYGIYDMIGNTWEWTSTLHKDDKKQDSKNKQFTLRGGSFIDSKDGSFNHKARNAVRMGNEADAGSNNLGFRCAADVKDKNPGKNEL